MQRIPLDGVAVNEDIAGGIVFVGVAAAGLESYEYAKSQKAERDKLWAKSESDKAHEHYKNRDRYQVKTDADGNIRVYDPNTNTFGSYNPDGSTKTYFKPSGGQGYFNRQPGK